MTDLQTDNGRECDGRDDTQERNRWDNAGELKIDNSFAERKARLRQGWRCGGSEKDFEVGPGDPKQDPDPAVKSQQAKNFKSNPTKFTSGPGRVAGWSRSCAPLF
ncbi:hypothetical protein PIB30_045853 [Stylosanthes scabra]|uniref:Uncharacterized protein n=1 Tax=Stylosanthes scabra TaxID=79078 RepID=A0ABU6WG94_9FABA|nr:hypothetical protein [Stylosanthes scabra]